MEIITYGSPEVLAGILLGISDIFASGDFRTLMLAVLGLGFITALLAYALAPQKLVGWYWLATVLGISALLVTPRTDVVIRDRIMTCTEGAANCMLITTVPRVPYALALIANLTSHVGDRLTGLFETAFGRIQYAVPVNSSDTLDTLMSRAHLMYRNSGLMFGAKAVRELAKVELVDPNVHFNATKYLENCAGPDVATGHIPADELRLSPDIWGTLKKYDAHPGRLTPTATGGVVTCLQLRDLLDVTMGGNFQNEKLAVARRLNADKGAGNTDTPLGSAALSAVDAQIEQAYASARLVGDGSMTASKIIRQNALINAMANAQGLQSQRINDPSALLLGMSEAQAKISTNTAWLTSAKVAEEAMPMIRTAIEAVLYACFPFLVLMCFVVTGATAIKLVVSYLHALLWIQLWPPLFAVLNFMATIATSKHLAAAGAMPATSTTPAMTGVSMLTSASVYENAISDMAVVGYLVMSIPVLAWAIVKGMDSIGAGALAGAATFSHGSHAGASQAASGNISLGNASTDQVNLAPSYREATFRTHDDGVSTTTSRWLPGSEFETSVMRQSNVGAETMLTNDRAQALTNGAQLAHRNAMQARQEESKQVGDAFSQAMGMAKAATHGWTTSEGWQEQHGGSRAGAVDKGIAIRQALQNQFGSQLNETILDSITKEAALNGGVSLGGGGGGIGANVGISGGIRGVTSATDSEALTQAVTMANDLARRNDVHVTTGTLDQFVHQGSYGEMGAASKSATQSFDDSFVRAHVASAAVSKSLSEETALTAAAQASESDSVRTRINAGNWSYGQLGLEGSAQARREWARQLQQDPSAANTRFSEISHQLQPGSGASPRFNDQFQEGPGGVAVPDPSKLGSQLDPDSVEALRQDYQNADPAARFGAPTPDANAVERVMDTHNNNDIVVRAEQGGMVPGQLPIAPKISAPRVMEVISYANGEVNKGIDRNNQAADAAADAARAKLAAAKARQNERQ